VNPIRLVHITTVDLSLRFLLLGQLQAYRDAGFETIGVSAPGPWVTELRESGIAHLAVPSLRRKQAPLADLKAFATLVNVLRRTRPTIVHTHTPKAGVLGRIAARLAGVPIVINTVHGFYVSDASPVFRRAVLFLERVAARCSDFEFCQSAEDLVLLRQLGVIDPRRSAYLGNGIDLRTFDPERIDRRTARARLNIPAEAVVVGTVGRLVWEKGYREFFAMAEALRGSDPNVVILAVGPLEPGKEDAVPSRVVDDVGGRGVVRFLGMRTDMPELYAAMDIFVLPSYREGFPRAAIEAAAMGLPLVATDIRGCREVVAEARNGFLVPPRDSGLLVDRVRRLIADTGLRARLAQESRRRALAEFDERRIVATTLDVYGRLLQEKQGVRIGPHQESPARG